MQIEYGDYDSIADNEAVAREATKRFCPLKFTKAEQLYDTELVILTHQCLYQGAHSYFTLIE